MATKDATSKKLQKKLAALMKWGEGLFKENTALKSKTEADEEAMKSMIKDIDDFLAKHKS